jgi:hypothetical protein
MRRAAIAAMVALASSSSCALFDPRGHVDGCTLCAVALSPCFERGGGILVNVDPSGPIAIGAVAYITVADDPRHCSGCKLELGPAPPELHAACVDAAICDAVVKERLVTVTGKAPGRTEVLLHWRDASSNDLVTRRIKIEVVAGS